MRIAPLVCLIVSLLLNCHVQAAAQPLPDFQVNENASPDGSEQSNPSIDGDGQGAFVVTWMDERDGIDFDIFAQIYSSDGTPMGANFEVSHEDGFTSQYRPDVAVDANGNFVITWIDKRTGDWDIYVQRYSSTGVELGGNFRVNEDLGNEEQEHPSIFSDGDGNFTVVWRTSEAATGTSTFNATPVTARLSATTS
jgi:hypothetical protein